MIDEKLKVEVNIISKEVDEIDIMEGNYYLLAFSRGKLETTIFIVPKNINNFRGNC